MCDGVHLSSEAAAAAEKNCWRGDNEALITHTQHPDIQMNFVTAALYVNSKLARTGTMPPLLVSAPSTRRLLSTSMT
jgi:hypothetical protein